MEKYVKKSRKSAVAAIVLGILLAAACAAIAMGWMILKDEYAEKFYAKPDANPFLYTAAKAALSGEEASVSQEDINSVLAALVEKQKASSQMESFDQIYLQIRPDQKVAVYTPLFANGMRIAVTSLLSLSFDVPNERLCAQVEEIHFGKMKLPISMALPVVEEKLPEGVSISGSSIFFDMNALALEIPNTEIRLTLEDVRLENESLIFRSNSLTQEAETYLSDFLKQSLSDLSDLFSSLF